MADKKYYSPTPEYAAYEAYKQGDPGPINAAVKEGYKVGKHPWLYDGKKKVGKAKRKRLSPKKKG